MTQHIIQSPDKHCVICGYHLYQLDPTGNCPECGTAIERSLRDETLANASPRWLTSVTLGVLGLLGCQLIDMLDVCLRMLVPMLFYNRRAWLWLRGIGVALTLLNFASLFAITAKEPGRPTRGQRWLRRLIRTIAVIQVLELIVILISPYVVPHTRTWDITYYALILSGDILTIPASIAISLLFIAWMRRDRAHALRRWLITLLIVGPIASIIGFISLRATELLNILLGPPYFFFPRLQDWPGIWFEQAVKMVDLIVVLCMLRQLNLARKRAATQTMEAYTRPIQHTN